MKFIKNLTIYDIKKNKAYQYLNEDTGEITVVDKLKDFIKEGTGYYLITGEVIIKDGTIYPALFGISSDDRGEMFEYYFFTQNGWISSNDEIYKLLNKTKSDIFPFKYHLNIKVENDLHESVQY